MPLRGQHPGKWSISSESGCILLTWWTTFSSSSSSLAGKNFFPSHYCSRRRRRRRLSNPFIRKWVRCAVFAEGYLSTNIGENLSALINNFKSDCFLPQAIPRRRMPAPALVLILFWPVLWVLFFFGYLPRKYSTFPHHINALPGELFVFCSKPLCCFIRNDAFSSCFQCRNWHFRM